MPAVEGVNSIGMMFVHVPAGSFPMGCGESDDACLHDEKPRHLVTIKQPFYLGRFEVTQGQWAAVMGTRPSTFKGDDLPVENVSWNDAQEFIRRLNALEKTDKYRLPTEAEWEYAARAGSMTKFSFDATSAGEYAWFWDNSNSMTHPVGEKLPNPLGVYDMHGNVWEWVQDWYGEDWYVYLLASSPGNPLRGTQSRLKDEQGLAINPSGPSEGIYRVLRGGSWSNDLRYLRSAHRHGYPPNVRRANLGFRLAISDGFGDLKKVEAMSSRPVRQPPPAQQPPASHVQQQPPPAQQQPPAQPPRIEVPGIEVPSTIKVPTLRF
jgi:formylglycine-generating enzyme required for sulfatase activity